MVERKEDYRIFVKIATDKACVEDVLCKIFLPKRLTEKIELYFYPNEEQRRKLEGIFEFSIIGELKGFSGKAMAEIQANKVYFKNRSTEYWGNNITESTFIGNPIDLKVIDFFHDDIKDTEQKTVGSFWLTSSKLISPAKTIVQSYNGNVEVKTVRQFKFTLANDIPLIFDTHFHYLKNEEGDDITFTELVAEFEIGTDKQDAKDIENDIVGYLDDFLMLVSFAERRRCICLGWGIGEPKTYTKYYRRDLVIPDIRKEHSFSDMLIDISDFEDFIKQAYNKFIEIEPKDLIRQAIQYTISVYDTERTLESLFLSLYSTLETLLLHFRKDHQLETVFASEKELGDFRDDIKNWLKNHPKLSNDKQKRILIYEKLPELNRISFSTAFEQLCNFYSVDLSDLWPLTKNSEGISLSEIRNKLIHGEVINTEPEQLRAFIGAKEHLQWIVERLILAFLGWTISKSNINKDYLARKMACYKDWKKDQKILFFGRRKIIEGVKNE